ncbi:MAG TPA: nickel pincer cofactor biosynthesis protein LarC, partial [Armatimonadota bacterium]|nr:nickel pincer cofactor biosynthesis protein LarC [Armatimonadota bacterium]
MRIAYFDCFSGISGNMALGALLACGLSRATLEAGLRTLPLDGWQLRVTPVTKRGIAATHVEVHAEDVHGHGHGQHHSPHRGLADILHLIAQGDISDRAKALASAIFTRLGEAEAEVHGTTPDQVHFHEVGAVDAIVDIVGAAIGIDALGIERVIASPLPLGRGFVTCAHGCFPIPAPATALLVRGVPLVEADVEAELVTPTGAAIITTLAERFGPLPGMTADRVGYGAGTKDLPRPNVLRLFLGEADRDRGVALRSDAPEDIVGLETNLDDTPGEVLGYLMERLFAAGAL